MAHAPKLYANAHVRKFVRGVTHILHSRNLRTNTFPALWEQSNIQNYICNNLIISSYNEPTVKTCFNHRTAWTNKNVMSFFLTALESFGDLTGFQVSGHSFPPVSNRRWHIPLINLGFWSQHDNSKSAGLIKWKIHFADITDKHGYQTEQRMNEWINKRTNKNTKEKSIKDKSICTSERPIMH